MIRRAAIGLRDAGQNGSTSPAIRVLMVDDDDCRIEHGYGFDGTSLRALNAADLANGLRTLADLIDKHLPMGARSGVRAACRRYLEDSIMRTGIALDDATQDRILREAVDNLVEKASGQ
jgi:hypothetical protein